MIKVVGILGVMTLACAVTGQGQSLVTSIKLGKDQIGLVKTAQGLSTRISFQEPVSEIICGDLYDAAAGRGSFVLQRGDRDVFVKPIPSKGISNLFVKTGQHGEHVYNFDLAIVSPSEAQRVVNVIGAAQPGDQTNQTAADQDVQARARKQADDTVREAEAEAENIIETAHRNADAITTQAAERAQKDLNRRFLNALMLGLREEKTGNPHVTVPNGVSITLDPEVVFFADKSYLRYTIHNNGAKDFSFTGLSLEDGSGKSVSADIIPARAGNVVKPGESMIGVIGIDSDPAHKRDRLVVSVLGEGKAEIAHLAVSL